MDILLEKLKELKIDILADSIWKEDINKNDVEKWLKNFDTQKEKDIALKLLSQFMYFGIKEIRVCLKTMYENFYKTPIIQEFRQKTNSTNLALYNEYLESQLEKTRFVILGNPSESSALLLYFFRQENKLKKNLFSNLFEVYSKLNDKIEKLIIIDDLISSGTQAVTFLKENHEILKKHTNIKISYFVLFATDYAIKTIKTKVKILDIKNFTIKFIFRLDSTYKVCSSDSKYLKSNEDIKELKENAQNQYLPKFKLDFKEYGFDNEDAFNKYFKACGYHDSQLLLGFFYNIPNNTIPIIWAESNTWTPIFKRYEKIYN